MILSRFEALRAFFSLNSLIEKVQKDKIGKNFVAFNIFILNDTYSKVMQLFELNKSELESYVDSGKTEVDFLNEVLINQYSEWFLYKKNYEIKVLDISDLDFKNGDIDLFELFVDKEFNTLVSLGLIKTEREEEIIL